MSDVEDLEGLVASPGFLLLKNRAKAQWGPTAFNARVSQAIVRADTDETFNLAKELAKLQFAQQEINALVSWPQQELDAHAKQLAKAAEPVSMMRGGR